MRVVKAKMAKRKPQPVTDSSSSKLDERAVASLLVVEALGDEDGADHVFRDAAVEIKRLHDGHLFVTRRKTNVLVMNVDPSGKMEVHDEFAFVIDHITTLAAECSENGERIDKATTPLRIEDIESFAKQHPGVSDTEDGHVHLDFISSCHPHVGITASYCSGSIYFECFACHRPMLAFAVAHRGKHDDPVEIDDDIFGHDAEPHRPKGMLH